ncbi:MAG TPA: glycosyltransferase family 9 protein [Chthoniobacterales bacterium]|nr:glycosyltransferase family 9 protein [Chthoniobacterales bacterium]
MSRILVIRGGAIGDFILTLPAIRLLREAFPSAHLEVLGYKQIVALAEMSGYADATRSIEYAPLASFFSRDSELAPELVEYFASFQQVVSYLFDPDRIFATNLKRAGVRNFLAGPGKMRDQEHAARQLARPLEALGLYLEDPAARILPNETRKVDPELLAIHPGSGSEAKNWPLERFVSLSRSFLRESKERRLLLIGGEADESRLTKLEKSLPNDRVRVARNLSLPAVANRLQNCETFIGHDSGISHVAAAVGIRSLLLFGPTDPAIWAPQNPQVRVLRSADLTMEGIALADVVARL